MCFLILASNWRKTRYALCDRIYCIRNFEDLLMLDKCVVLSALKCATVEVA